MLRTAGGTVMALLLGSCSLLNTPDSPDLCREHSASCDPLADCKSAGSTFRCVCPPGYRDVHGDGTLCRDRDECADGSARCHKLATCTNEPPGSFTCTCPRGYRESAEGRQCDEIDQCTSGENDCDPGTQDCVDLEGPRWDCQCKPGFERGQGAGCDDIDECARGEDDCVAPAECVNTKSEFDCRCPPGTTPLDRTHCETHDPCEPGHHACRENTQCVVSGNGHQCDCLPGYARIDSARCGDIDECQDEPCKEGARCVNSEGGFSCECEGYYTAVDGGCEDRRLVWSTGLGAYLMMQPLVDEGGNLFLAGSFTGTIELCGEPYTSQGSYDVFLVKLAPEQEHACLWAPRIFGDIDVDELLGATIDLDGNPVLSITFSGTLDFQGAVADSRGYRARAIAKLDGQDGHGLWAQTFYNVDPDSAGSRILYGGLSTDAQGNVLWATGVRGGQAIDAARVAGSAERDAVVSMLDAGDGRVVWSTVFGSPFEGIATGVAVAPDGDIAVTGIFQNWIDIESEALHSAVRASGRWAGFATVLSADDREPRWRQLIEGFVDPSDAHRAVGLSVVATDDDQVVVGGSFEDTLKVGSDERSAGWRDVFLLGLNAHTGDRTWLRTFGNAKDDVLDQLAYADGQLVAVGSFEGVVGFGGTTLKALGRDVFVLAFDPSGEPSWAQRFGGMGYDHVAAVAKNRRGDSFATGSFMPPMFVGGSELPAGGSDSGFVLELRR